MVPMFRFTCACCGEVQDGVPSFAAAAPLAYEALSEVEQRERAWLSSEVCVIDDTFFFVRGLIEIPVVGADEPLVWNVWASLSEASVAEYTAVYDDHARTEAGPYFAWLSAAIPLYPDLDTVRACVNVRPLGMRPLITIEPSDHPLSVDQHQGITADRLAEVFAVCAHGAHDDEG